VPVDVSEHTADRGVNAVRCRRGLV